MARRPTQHIAKVKELRERLWPDLTEEELWYRKEHDGFTTIPRTLPLIMTIIDDLTKGAPASLVYFELWCRAFDEMYVSLSKAESHSFHSGFTGQRARRTWLARVRKLAELGFIRVAPGTAGDCSHAVIINPHIVLRRLKLRGESGLTEAKYNALLERAIEIGAKDVDQDPKNLYENQPDDLDDEIPF